MEALTLKERLARKDRKLITSMTLDGDSVDFRRPSFKERVSILKAAKEAGDTTGDENPQATSHEGGLRLIARLAAAVIYDPSTKTRVYDPFNVGDVDFLADSPWLEDIQAQVKRAFNPTMEEARGNSSATHENA
ncbi:hypothetical protein DRW03_21235 [Corallococcus sp. H22C18031201]|nr:hypothetical protein DRW03_21235 [Corallococcus sp. H22C18031201]